MLNNPFNFFQTYTFSFLLFLSHLKIFSESYMKYKNKIILQIYGFQKKRCVLIKLMIKNGKL